MLFAWSDIFRIYMTEHKLFLELKRESYIVILNILDNDLMTRPLWAF